MSACSRYVLSVVLLGCLVLQPARRAVADDGMESDTPGRQYFAEGHMRHEFVAAEGVAKGHIARELFTTADPRTLQILLFDPDDGVALSAAWQRLRMQMLARLVSVDAAVHGVRIPEAWTREFLGFVEGRLRVPVPDGWSGVVRDAVYDSSGTPSFPVTFSPHADMYAVDELEDESKGVFRGIERGRMTAPHVWLDLDPVATLGFSGGLPFEGEDRYFELPERLQVLIPDPASTKSLPRYSGIATSDRAVVALEDSPRPLGGELIGIDTTRGRQPKVLWEKPLDSRWSDDWQGSTWFTELRTTSGNVLLFHATHDAIGVEAFRLADGKRLFSFSSHFPDAPGHEAMR